MSFFEGLHAEVTKEGRGRPLYVRFFLGVIELFDRLRRVGRRGR